MSNEQTELTILPEVAVPDGVGIFKRTQALVNADIIWPEGQSQYWYVKHLVGLPFAITSEPRYATNPAKTIQREDGSTFTMQPQDVAQVTIRFFNAEDYTFGEPRLATLSGAFLLNQVRAMTLHQLTGNLWTVAHRPGAKFSTPGGQARMLKVYEHGVDKPPEEASYVGSVLADDPIGSRVSTFNAAALAAAVTEHQGLRDKPTNKVRAEIAKMRTRSDIVGDRIMEKMAAEQG